VQIFETPPSLKGETLPLKFLVKWTPQHIKVASRGEEKPLQARSQLLLDGGWEWFSKGSQLNHIPARGMEKLERHGLKVFDHSVLHLFS